MSKISPISPPVQPSLPLVRHPFGHYRVQTVPRGESLTQQHMAQECDINYMMEKFQHTGQIKGTTEQPQYLDLTNVTTYNDAIRQVSEAQTAFLSLPSKVRNHYNNDPSAFLHAIHAGEDRDFLASAGLLNLESGEAATRPTEAQEEETPPPPPPSSPPSSD